MYVKWGTGTESACSSCGSRHSSFSRYGITSSRRGKRKMKASLISSTKLSHPRVTGRTIWMAMCGKLRRIRLRYRSVSIILSVLSVLSPLCAVASRVAQSAVPTTLAAAGMRKVVDKGNCPLWIGTLNEQHGHPWLDHSLLLNTAIPAGAPACRDAIRQPGDLPAPLDPPAWVARPGDTNARLALGIDVSNAGALLRQPRDSKVLAKATRPHFWPLKLHLPERIVRGGIQQHRLAQAAMILLIRLLIPFEVRRIQPALLRAGDTKKGCVPLPFQWISSLRLAIAMRRPHLHRL